MKLMLVIYSGIELFMQNPLNPQLENQMERAVLEVINELLLMETQERFCQCEKFRSDVAALTLNHISPRYTTSFQGSLYTLSDIQADEDLQVNIRKITANVLEMVSQNPRCDQVDCPLKLQLERTEETLL